MKVTVVGGGLAGLCAAIVAAESGADVTLYEASGSLGGRARSGDGPYGVNLGPHVVLRGGAIDRFFAQRDLPLPGTMPSPFGVRVVDGSGLHGLWAAVAPIAAAQRRAPAPADRSFADWARSSFGRRVGDRLVSLSGLVTFHHDPGSLAADFVWSGVRRTLGHPHRVRYVRGGWQTLVDALETRVRALGVRVALHEPVDTLPTDVPVIVALPLRPAGSLLGTDLDWPSARTALLDLAVASEAGLAGIVLDLSPDLGGCIMAERFSGLDRSLAPPGVELVQVQYGVAPDVSLDAAVARMERTVDGLGAWRDHEIWRRAMVVEGSSGAVDPVGATWRDRPEIDRGGDRFLAGDSVAAPGLLSEVAVNAGVRAAHLAVDAGRRRVFAPGWPTATLTPSMRAAVLTATLPGAVAVVAPGPSAAEPVTEVGAGHTVRSTRRSTTITSDDGDRVVSITAPRRRRAP